MSSVIQDLLIEAHARGMAATSAGRVADYIPQLGKADPRWFGIVIHTISGEVFDVGEANLPFTLQSISKIFALACVQAAGINPYNYTFAEPSGDAFHSIVRLEEERGRPRNPLINAGAIPVSSLLPGSSSREKFASLLNFLKRCMEDQRLTMDQAVYESECSSGFRNRALANYMKHFNVIDDPDTAVDTYFRQCSIKVNTKQLARLSLFLANDGRDPVTRKEIVDAKTNRSLLALMTTCGLYDEVGRFAVTVGLPAKSGVSGGILAIVPGRMSIVVFGPALGSRGNSVAGIEALEYLSSALNLSVFSADN